jgi:hypothetical protein
MATRAKGTLVEEILEATKLKEQGAKESAETFVGRLLEGIQGLSNTQYDKLSAKARNWYEKGVNEFNADKPVTLPDGVRTDDEPAEEEPEEASAEAGDDEPTGDEDMATTTTRRTAKKAEDCH